MPATAVPRPGSRFAAALLGAACLAACARDEPGSPIGVEVGSPAGPASGEPHLASAEDGAAILSWIQATDTGHVLAFSRFADDEWSSAREVARGDDWFVNWADFPSVVPAARGRLAAHWLVKREGGTYAYDVSVALSQDDGNTWSQPALLHHDDTPTEHGFVSLFPRDGAFHAVWLDGRNMSGDGGGHTAHGEGGGGMSLRYAALGLDGGTTRAAQIDGLVCDCCQTDAAATDTGAVVVYRDRTEAEIRDIYAIVHDGQGWLEPAPVANDGWEIDGCPVNGPAVAAAGDEVAVAWFTAAGDVPRVMFARSRDGGRTFELPVEIDRGSTGRVDVVLRDDQEAVVSWISGASQDQRAELRARGVSSSGELGPVRVIVAADATRASGFPQMVNYREQLLFAWTDPATPAQVRTALAEW